MTPSSSRVPRPRIEAAVERAHRQAAKVTGEGRVARYIPELASADPRLLAIAVHPVDDEPVLAGDVDEPFTLQSVSKILSLSLVLRQQQQPWLDELEVEPSGDAFHSIVRLEEEGGRPRNPLINAGAIAVTSRVPGATARQKSSAFIAFLRELDERPAYRMDRAVYRSEARTGDRNRALAHFMSHHGRITEPDVAVDAYFRQCAVSVSTGELARIALFLAGRGTDPRTERAHLTPAQSRSVLAIMMMCGLYDEVGHFAVRVGLPAKSGVSGCILAVVPGAMTIAAFSPGLGALGNSVGAMRALEVLSDELELSLFG